MTAPNPMLVALNRFGLGPKGAAALYLGNSAADPRAFVRSELEKPGAGQATGVPTAKLLKGLFDFQEQTRLAREQKTQESANAVAPNMMEQGSGAPSAPPPPPDARYVQTTFQAEALARINRALEAPVGLVERLVAFWSNHFAISAAKSAIARTGAGAFEREAIRPHVLGRFAEMLKAVEQHPVMLHYLDNQLSMGPNSRAGLNQKKGLNENLAREILELHTLGVNGGYAQADVTNLSKIITGWTFVGREGRLGEPGTFIFVPNWHEPGAPALLGKTYTQEGKTKGEAALADLARHPSTAKFIATKLVRHFIADEPPSALVAKLEKTFRETDGDLKAVALTLVNAEESWSTPLTKMRNPWEFLIASLRLTGVTPEGAQRVIGALNQLGAPLWAPPGPNGFPDTNAAWASPEGMKLRMDMASGMAGRLQALNPSAVLNEAYGVAASEATRTAIARAESKRQGMALLLLSPEMQRR
jgi:uncharacterized protein (DUF1800 family)